MTMDAPRCNCESPLGDLFPDRGCPVHGTRAMRDQIGDAVRTREDLRRAAQTAVGGMQAAVGFLRDREDLSREYVAEVLEDTWRALRDVADATPSFDPTGSERWPR